MTRAASRGLDAAALGQQQPFAEGQRLDREADVDRQLEQQALAVLADAGHASGRARAATARRARRPPRSPPTMIVSVPVSACGTLPETGASSIRAPIDRTRSAIVDAGLGADGAHVDVDLPGRQPGEDAVRPGGDRLERRVVADHAEHDVGGGRDLARRRLPAQAAVDQRLRLGDGAVGGVHLDGRRRAGGRRSGRPSSRGRRIRPTLIVSPPSICSTSSALSSRPAALRIGSTWSGRRKPTIAPSTAGLRSVHATATAPGVVSWRSRDGRPSAATCARCRESCGLLEARVVLAPVVVGQALDPLAGHAARSAGPSPSASRRSRRSPRARRTAGSRPRPRARSASTAAAGSRPARSAGSGAAARRRSSTRRCGAPAPAP